MSDIKIRIAAKTDVGLERANNEDNLQVAANLDEVQMRWVNNEVCELGRRGTLLVVADGMGGMNAGEVASEIAINTVRELFAPEKITDEVVKSRYTIEKYMNSTIVEADKRIKEFAKDNPDSRGMGTTIVMGWLFDGMLYVSWCGDSRAYIYNRNTGLFQISKDHSYVQDLVDQGKISKEDAFDFPDSNIITRSLSDATAKAKPESMLRPQPLCNGDIILLCSDGLNGMIRDTEIEQVIRQNEDNMTTCVDALIGAALDAAGADNCTVVLCQILSGGEDSDASRIPSFSRKILGENANTNYMAVPSNGKNKRLSLIWVILGLLFVVFCGLLALYLTDNFPFLKKEVALEKVDVAETTNRTGTSDSIKTTDSTISADDNNGSVISETSTEEVNQPKKEKFEDIVKQDNKEKSRKSISQTSNVDALNKEKGDSVVKGNETDDQEEINGQKGSELTPVPSTGGSVLGPLHGVKSQNIYP